MTGRYIYRIEAMYERKMLSYEYILLLSRSDTIYILFSREIDWILSSHLSWNDFRSYISTLCVSTYTVWHFNAVFIKTWFISQSFIRLSYNMKTSMCEVHRRLLSPGLLLSCVFRRKSDVFEIYMTSIFRDKM